MAKPNLGEVASQKWYKTHSDLCHNSQRNALNVIKQLPLSRGNESLVRA